MAGFQAEMADFFVALREAKSTSMLAHLAALRGMSAAEGVEDASLLQELHQACVEQARVWVQQRVPQLVVSFEAHVHGRDRDLLAADHALLSLLCCWPLRLHTACPCAVVRRSRPVSDPYMW